MSSMNIRSNEELIAARLAIEDELSDHHDAPHGPIHALPSVKMLMSARTRESSFPITEAFQHYGGYQTNDRGEYDAAVRQRAANDLPAFGLEMAARYPQIFRIMLLAIVHKESCKMVYTAWYWNVIRTQRRLAELRALRTAVLALDNRLGLEWAGVVPSNPATSSIDIKAYNKWSLLQVIDVEMSHLEDCESIVRPYQLGVFGYGHIFPFVAAFVLPTGDADADYNMSFSAAAEVCDIKQVWLHQEYHRRAHLMLITDLITAMAPSNQADDMDVFTGCPVGASAQQLQEAYEAMGLLFATKAGKRLKIVKVPALLSEEGTSSGSKSVWNEISL